MKRKFLCLLTVLLLAGLLAGCANNSSQNAGQLRPQDDFYEAVNYEVMANWEIPANRASMTYFVQNVETIYNKINAEIKAAAAEMLNLTPGSDEWNVAAFYLTGLDKQQRDNGGFGEIAGQFLAEVDQAASVPELLETTLRFGRNYNLTYLGSFIYEPDFMDSKRKILCLNKPDIGLEKETWLAEDTDNQEIVAAYCDMLKKLWVQAGNPESTAEQTVAQVTEMMKDIAQDSLSNSDSFNPQKIYNPYPINELPDFLFNGLLTEQQIIEICGVSAEENLNIIDVGAQKRLANWLTEENLPLLKAYIKLTFYADTANFREITALEIKQAYDAQIYGMEPDDFERKTSLSVRDTLSFQCSKLFCDKYFSEAAKQDVEAMIEDIVAAYAKRIDTLTWMSESTKEAAKLKLANLTYNVGYPNEWPQNNYSLELQSPEQGGLYIDNYFKIRNAQADYNFASKDEPLKRDEWFSAPHEVNAYYLPSTNSITILAGILQEPFYSPNASEEEKLGGIGMVIAHELTHAFDTAGSQYDEQGNLRNWWTDEDLQSFQALAAKVVEYYDGMEIDGYQVNGNLTVGENIADLGSLACITQIAKENNLDLQALYKAYANIWAGKMRPEFLNILVTTDEHSPNKIRVNAVLSAIDEFYTAFNVQPDDGMYQAPEKRPAIW